MRSVVVGVAAAWLATGVCAADDPATPNGPAIPNWLYFAGAEGWHAALSAMVDCCGRRADSSSKVSH